MTNHSAWSLLATGKIVDFHDPQPDTIDIYNLIYAISQTNRYVGNTIGFYSNAEHSVLIAQKLLQDGFPPLVALGGLMHDLSEGVIGDISYPMQQYLFGEAPEAKVAYKRLQRKIDEIICAQVGVSPAETIYHPKVKEYDLRICLDERKVFLGGNNTPWDLDLAGYSPLGITHFYRCWPPDAATMFLRWFKLLCRDAGVSGLAKLG